MQVIQYEDKRSERAADYIAMKTPVLSSTTIQGYKTYLKNNMERIADVPLDDITPRLEQDWVNELTVAKSAKTVHNVYGFFTAVMNYHGAGIDLGRVTLPKKTRQFKLLPKPEIVLNTLINLFISSISSSE